MSRKEVQRLAVIEQVLQGGLGQAQAALMLSLSVRQIKRLCRRVRLQGAAGLISRRRGQPSQRRIASKQRENYVELLRDCYADFGPPLAHEYLRREHGFAWSVQTLRGWMIGVGLWPARRSRVARVPGRVGADRRQSPRLVRRSFGQALPDLLHRRRHRWGAVRSAEAPLAAEDARGLRSVIEAQLAPFQADNAEQAFSYASASIREMFGTAERFLAMVRGSYPAV